MLLHNGQPAFVEAVHHIPANCIVYNFAVNDLKCYAVGKNQILVHNENGAEGTKAVLGLDKHLDNFATAHQGKKVLQLAKAPMNWKPDFTKLMNDPNSEVFFNLKDVDVWPGLSRAASGKGFGATDWELLQIYTNKDWWPRIKWINELGIQVPNPFN